MPILSSFLSYALLFVILVVIAVAGAMIGIKLAKNKNAKAESVAKEENTETVE